MGDPRQELRAPFLGKVLLRAGGYAGRVPLPNDFKERLPIAGKVLAIVIILDLRPFFQKSRLLYRSE